MPSGRARSVARRALRWLLIPWELFEAGNELAIGVAMFLVPFAIAFTLGGRLGTLGAWAPALCSVVSALGGLRMTRAPRRVDTKPRREGKGEGELRLVHDGATRIGAWSFAFVGVAGVTGLARTHGQVGVAFGVSAFVVSGLAAASISARVRVSAAGFSTRFGAVPWSDVHWLDATEGEPLVLALPDRRVRVVGTDAAKLEALFAAEDVAGPVRAF